MAFYTPLLGGARSNVSRSKNEFNITTFWMVPHPQISDAYKYLCICKIRGLHFARKPSKHAPSHGSKRTSPACLAELWRSNRNSSACLLSCGRGQAYSTYASQPAARHLAPSSAPAHADGHAHMYSRKFPFSKYIHQPNLMSILTVA